MRKTALSTPLGYGVAIATSADRHSDELTAARGARQESSRTDLPVRRILSAMDTAAELDQARESYASCAWTAAFEVFRRADQAASLGVGDLERLARSAYMLGRDDDYRGGLERAHRLHLDSGDAPRAVRCAFWISSFV